MTDNRSGKNLFSIVKLCIGYILFIIAIAYGLYRAPEELWQIKPLWLVLTILAIMIMTTLQVIQFLLFLNHHNIKSDWLLPALITTRKGILNVILPIRSGTIAVIPIITQNYSLKWHDYIRFMLVASISSLIVSGLAFLGLIFEPIHFFTILLLTTLSIILVLYFFVSAYLRCFPFLFLIACGLYATILFSFWFLIKGMGFTIGLIEASSFSIAINTLSQLTITPGNMGVREMLLGLIAPYISLPISVGIITGAVFFVLRIMVNAVILLCLEWISQYYKR